jgi:hypothetical protein
VSQRRDVATNLRITCVGMFSTTSVTAFFLNSFESPLASLPTSTAGLCQPAPDSLRVNTPTHSTSFQTLLKAAAVSDGDGPQTRQRLDHIAVENYQIEVNDRFDRDVSEDAAVGACFAATGGIRREQVRQPGSIVESSRVADADVLGPAGEIEGF